MTQIDFTDNALWKTRFPKFLHAQPYEVILGPGDVLYLPPFVYHAVTVVTAPAGNITDAVSISVSVHTSCPEAELRARLIDESLKLEALLENLPFEKRICALFHHFAGIFDKNTEEMVRYHFVCYFFLIATFILCSSFFVLPSLFFLLHHLLFQGSFLK